MKNVIIILLIFLTFCSCNKIKTRNIELCYFKIKKIERCDNISLKIKKEKGKTIYEYFDSTDNKEFKPTIEKIIDTDSIIICDYLTCPLTDFRDYKINDKIYRVNKYLYDEQSSVDEEFEIYFSDSIGLLIGFSGSWNKHETYKYDAISSDLINLIKEDRTGFWTYNN